MNLHYRSQIRSHNFNAGELAIELICCCGGAMEPRWVSVRDRLPDLDKEVQVLVIEMDSEIGYASAKLTGKGWIFLTAPISTQVAQWLEADRLYCDEEIRNIPKPPFR